MLGALILSMALILSQLSRFNLKWLTLGFPDSSVGKESACNAGDPGSIPGSGRSPGEGKGYPLQYSGLEKSKDCIFQSKELEATFTFT